MIYMIYIPVPTNNLQGQSIISPVSVILLLKIFGYGNLMFNGNEIFDKYVADA